MTTCAVAIKQYHERVVRVLWQRIRTSVRPGTGVPLVLCNGIGALELLDPLVEQLTDDQRPMQRTAQPDKEVR